MAFADSGTPDEIVRIGVTFRARNGGPGPSKQKEPICADNARKLLPARRDVARALRLLKDLGFQETSRGIATATVRATRQQFAKLKLRGELRQLIDEMRIQGPHMYVPHSPTSRRRRKTDVERRRGPRAKMSPFKLAATFATTEIPPTPPAPSAEPPKPPEVPGTYLRIPMDLAEKINARSLRENGRRGAGVRVALVDSGFEHSHPFFDKNGFRSKVILAKGATDPDRDTDGHGTGVSANVFSIAPDVTFIGVKLEGEPDTDDDGACLLEGFHKALAEKPHVISLSVGYNLVDSNGKQLATLTEGLKALETEIRAAIASGVVVVAAAGNGHFMFPGQMPEVISVGGVFVDEEGARASSFASAFVSQIYKDRQVPDVCGLVGMANRNAAYITLPVPAGCETDSDNSQTDGTRPDDGWSIFSGTSSAAPQVAAVCALLLEKESLTPEQVRQRLKGTAIKVGVGISNKRTGAVSAKRGATGAGLVDALAAVTNTPS